MQKRFLRVDKHVSIAVSYFYWTAIFDTLDAKPKAYFVGRKVHFFLMKNLVCYSQVAFE